MNFLRDESKMGDDVNRKKEKHVTLQSRVVRNKFCCGLGVRAVRTGSIGRDRQRPGENSDPPQGKARSLGPRLVSE
jgi:hypothetical protein